MSNQPIENYGVIGNMRTAALVGRDASIDWYCCPNFDSPSVFGALLDDAKGGHFQVIPCGEGSAHRQMYWPDTNVLMTRFLIPDGVGEVIDYMAVGTEEAKSRHYPLMREIRVTRGRMTFKVICEPAFNYARDDHRTTVTRSGAVFDTTGLSLALSSTVPLQRTAKGVACEFTLNENESVTFALETHSQHCAPNPVGSGIAEELLMGTVHFWRTWLSQSTYKGRWRETVERSALLLKLLTYEPTGAIVASPTMGLPEFIGGGRNWDYRYTWIRDAAFTLYALLRIGFKSEAGAFMNWLEARCKEVEPDGQLQIVYGIDGRHDLTETTLSHLSGYKDSRPVRVGNDAYRQLQLDIYGELMDSAYLFNKYGTPVSFELWSYLRQLVDWVANNWNQPDEGIWEVRSGKQNFVYSKLMCWVALDRGLRLADKRSFPADRARWLTVRDQIYETIMARGWNEKLGSFVQSFGSDVLDASNLIMPLVFFMGPRDPRMLGTIAAINGAPGTGGLVSDSLVYRYSAGQDGIEGREGTFNMCTFWLVEAMTRAASTPAELARARVLFERMLGYANHVGLFGEQLGPSGEALGNFPQAFTHLALISSAYCLDSYMNRRM